MRKQNWVTTVVLTLLCLNPIGFPLALFNDLTSFDMASEKANADIGWLSGYGYRKQFNVTGSISGAQTNYTIRVTVHYGNGIDSGRDVYLNGKVSKNFQDVRFTKDDGLTLLECNREEWYHGDKATFSIMIPNIPISPNNATLYVYYDNPAVSWRKYDGNPVLTKGSVGSWENESVRQPSIVWNGSHYLMFYCGTRHPYAPNPNNYETAIGLAISTNGINWTKYSGNPVFTKSGTGWEANCVASPSVIYNATTQTYHMWYSADSSAAGWTYAVGYANSSDGINWVRGPNNPILTGTTGKFDQNSIYGLFVTYNGTHYVGTIIGQDAIGIKTGVAISSTPWTGWTKLNDGNAVLTYTEAWERSEAQITDLRLIGITYYGVMTGGRGERQMQVGMVKSTNLISWTKDSANPTLENWAGTFDAQQLHEPRFLQMSDTGRWRIYYGGASEGGDFGNFAIGFAEIAFPDYPPFVSEFAGSPINNGDNTFQIFADFDGSRGDDGSEEGFNVQSGAWTVMSERYDVPFGEANFFYEGYGWEGYGAGTSLYDSMNRNQTNFAIEVRAKLAYTGSASANYSVLFRWQDSGNYYRIQYVEGTSETNERLALTKVVGGSNTEIASYSLTTDTDWHTIKILVNDTNCKVFFDGKQRIPSSGWESLGEFSSGKIGFQVESARSHFDDLKVYKYVEPEPSITGLGTEEIVSESALFAIIFSLILLIIVLWIVKKRRDKSTKLDDTKKHAMKMEIDEVKNSVSTVQGAHNRQVEH